MTFKKYLSMITLGLGLSLTYNGCVQNSEDMGSLYYDCDFREKNQGEILNILENSYRKLKNGNKQGIVDIADFCNIKDLNLEERTIIIKIKY